ncbi:MAG: hypothetical protein AAFU64_13990, partial [Bacteroidota bacterium]
MALSLSQNFNLTFPAQRSPSEGWCPPGAVKTPLCFLEIEGRITLLPKNPSFEPTPFKYDRESPWTNALFLKGELYDPQSQENKA